MTAQQKQLENTKKDIRSILLAAPDGLPMRKLERDYRMIIGRFIPFTEFGYTKLEFFLRDIPDVVRLQWSHSNDYICKGIADELTKHIDKLVQSQRVNKTARFPTRGRRSPTMSTSYRTPSFNVPRRLKNSMTSSSFFTSRVTPKPVSLYNFSAPVYKPPDPVYKPPAPVYKPPDPVYKPPVSVLAPVSASVAKILPLTTAMQRISQLVEDSPGGITPSDLLLAYKRKFDVDIDFDAYEFEDFEDFLEQVPGLKPKNVDGILRICIASPEIKSPKPAVVDSFQTTSKKIYNWPSPYNDSTPLEPLHMNSSSPIPQPSYPSSRSRDVQDKYEDDVNESSPLISETLKKTFREILQRQPRGIFMTDFLLCYKVYTKEDLDLQELGYYSLLDLVDSLPDVFARSQPPGCKSDWQLFDALSKQTLKQQPLGAHPVTTTILDSILGNIRKILQAEPDGIYLDQFIHIYSLNCEQPLILSQLGFDDFTKFFLAIEDEIPLKLDYSCDRPKIHLNRKQSTPVNQPRRFDTSYFGKIPADAVQLGESYSTQSVPVVKAGVYFPIYTGTIESPGLFWIQLKGETTSLRLSALMDDLDKVYSSAALSQEYVMLDRHIVVGAVCAGVWDHDCTWHRVSIVGMEINYVRAFFVDYGTFGNIPKQNLRYLKKEFMQLPKQAIKARMAHVSPPLGGCDWPPEARRRLLSICVDKVLMADLLPSTMYPNVLSLWLCDCSDKKYEDEVHLSMLLIKEGLAVYCDDKAVLQSNSASASQQPSTNASSFLPPVSPVNLITPNVVEAVKAFVTLYQFQNANQTNTGLLDTILQPNALQQLLQTGSTSTLLNQTPATFNPLANYGSATNISTNNLNYPYQQSSDSAFVSGATLSPQSSTASYLNLPKSQPYAVIEPPKEYPASVKNLPSFINSPTPQSSESTSFQIVEEDDGSEEMFDEDDDEESFNRVLEQYGSSQKSVHRVILQQGYTIHIVAIDVIPYVSCGDISSLFWPSEGPLCLQRRLQNSHISVPSLILCEVEYADLFLQLRNLRVKGIQVIQGETSIVLYRLDDVTRILDVFGHHSPTIRLEIKRELNQFNPNSDSWRFFSDMSLDDRNNETLDTDSEKFNRMCIYDLKSAIEGLRFKRLKVKKENGAQTALRELEKIEIQYQRYTRRIKEIEALCGSYN